MCYCLLDLQELNSAGDTDIDTALKLIEFGGRLLVRRDGDGLFYTTDMKVGCYRLMFVDNKSSRGDCFNNS